MSRALRLLALGLIAGILAIGVPAIATDTDATDPNDTAGPLDVRELRLEHDRGPLVWSFVTFARWTISRSWDRGYFAIRLDTRGDEEIDRVVVMRSDGRSLRGLLYAVRADGRHVLNAKPRTSKDGPRRASVTVAKRKLSIAKGRVSYFWYAVSIYTGPTCRRTCLDRIPDEGRIEQILPGPSPTPTPSPTP